MIDPVCGMTVAEGGPHTLVHDGTTYGFCCGGCKTKFAADPAKYLAAQAAKVAMGTPVPAPARKRLPMAMAGGGAMAMAPTSASREMIGAAIAAAAPPMIDPVCGMTVAPGGPHTLVLNGTTYGFCCAGCKTKFAADPAKYLAAGPSMAAMGAPAPGPARKRLAMAPAAPAEATETAAPATAAPAMIDPVCGMTVAPGGPHTLVLDGTTYGFCCAGCKTKFAADPAKYLTAKDVGSGDGVGHGHGHGHGHGDDGAHADAARTEAAGPARSKATRYTCPMDPEVIEDRPGPCRICGMALEPMTPTATADDGGELHDMTRRLIVAAVLTVPLMALAMSDMLPGDPFGAGLSMRARALVELAMATPVATWAAWPFYQRAIASIRYRALNMFTLIGLGVFAAFAYSLAAVAIPDAFPDAAKVMGAVPVYFEAAAAIVTLVLVGQVLELRARRRTGDALRALLELAPTTARRLDADGTEREVPLAVIVPGDRLRVRAGDKVPVDGALVLGATAIDEAIVTGEPMPRAKAVGDKVIGGTVNGTGAFVMRAEQVGDDTLVARIVAMVATAQRSRAPIQRAADAAAA
ncbi:MAG: YHS domain-containing protein, partial [Deltaproteobacteria bacterium]|nr:YHS domain-containing protein [Deltaproteobacteria bacterium]